MSLRTKYTATNFKYAAIIHEIRGQYKFLSCLTHPALEKEAPSSYAGAFVFGYRPFRLSEDTVQHTRRTN